MTYILQAKPEDAQAYEAAVRELQTVLNENGFDCGVADGKWGPNTQGALENLQAERPDLYASMVHQINDAIQMMQPGEWERADSPKFFYDVANKAESNPFGQVYTDRPDQGVEVVPDIQGAPQDYEGQYLPKEEPPAQVQENGNLEFNGTLCEDIMALQGMLGIPEDQQAPVIGPKTIEGLHGQLEEVFGDNWSSALQAMKQDQSHGGPEWTQLSMEKPDIAMLAQQLDEVKDPRYQGESGPSIFDTLIPNGKVEDQPVVKTDEPDIKIDCDTSSVGPCDAQVQGGGFDVMGPLNLP